MRVAAIVLISCTSSDPVPTRDASPSPTACTLVSGACLSAAGQCCAQRGILFDETRMCLTGVERAIGCDPTPIRADGACEALGVVGCAVTREGSVRRLWFLASRTPGFQAAEKCSEMENAMVTAFKQCE